MWSRERKGIGKKGEKTEKELKSRREKDAEGMGRGKRCLQRSAVMPSATWAPSVTGTRSGWPHRQGWKNRVSLWQRLLLPIGKQLPSGWVNGWMDGEWLAGWMNRTKTSGRIGQELNEWKGGRTRVRSERIPMLGWRTLNCNAGAKGGLEGLPPHPLQSPS